MKAAYEKDCATPWICSKGWPVDTDVQAIAMLHAKKDRLLSDLSITREKFRDAAEVNTRHDLPREEILSLIEEIGTHRDSQVKKKWEYQDDIEAVAYTVDDTTTKGMIDAITKLAEEHFK